MIKKAFKLTQEGIDELRAELEHGVNVLRPEIAERIKSARELGDLSENAEYQIARQDQEKNDGRILELEYILANTEVIQKPKSDGKVVIGSTVVLKNADGKEKQFQVVGTIEADPLEGKISDESPIGWALLGKKEGEQVEIKTPVETAVYTVADIL